ncbi:MAG TPA: PEP-CTERM sorting domain-containing protein [Desulfobulbaceae bacterium]|nr:PEP-CTERM sorting domain-containing protein [Desulfobulbaceae bacterium]
MFGKGGGYLSRWQEKTMLCIHKYKEDTMKKRLLPTVTLALCIAFMLTGSCLATLIGSHTRTLDLGQIIGQNTSFSFVPFYSLVNVPDAPDPSAVAPFGPISLNQSDWGATNLTYNADSSTTEFTHAASYLTNGWDNELGETIFSTHHSQSFGFSQSSLLTGSGFIYPDFHGSTITAMILTIDTFSQNSLVYHVDYYDGNNPGPVPEPATMLLFSTGLVGLVAARRKRNRR